MLTYATMNEFIIPLATSIFRCLADPFRLRLFRLILRSPNLCVCDLGEICQAKQYNISRAVRELKLAKLVVEKKEGRWSHLFPAELPPTLAFVQQVQQWSAEGFDIDDQRLATRLAEKVRAAADLCSPLEPVLVRSTGTTRSKKSLPRGEPHAPPT